MQQYVSVKTNVLACLIEMKIEMAATKWDFRRVMFSNHIIHMTSDAPYVFNITGMLVGPMIMIKIT
jgi:hypothetical protein